MNFQKSKIKNLKKGFTLIELLVVIAILGILAVVLLTVINPVDKINSANDTGVVSFADQMGRAEDAYAASHNNFYAGGSATVTDLATPLGVLNTAGESKVSTYTAPSGTYVLNFLNAPAAACASGTACTGYAIIVTNLQAKSKTATPVYQVVNGKGCYVATAITQAQLTTLGSASTGAGSCP